MSLLLIILSKIQKTGPDCPDFSERILFYFKTIQFVKNTLEYIVLFFLPPSICDIKRNNWIIQVVLLKCSSEKVCFRKGKKRGGNKKQQLHVILECMLQKWCLRRCWKCIPWASKHSWIWHRIFLKVSAITSGVTAWILYWMFLD